MTRPIFLLVPLALLGATPAAAQTTPARRVDREAAAQRAELIRTQNAMREQESRRAEAQEFIDRNRKLESRSPRARSDYPLVPQIDPGEIWTDAERAEALNANLLALTARGVPPRRLREVTPGAWPVPQRTPLRLTFVSPDGGALLPLNVSVRFEGIQDDPPVTVAADLVADSTGTYRLEIPPLRSGDYLMRVITTPIDFPVVRHHLSEQRLSVWE